MTNGAFTYDELILSDLYKDAYGFRPRESFWANWNSSKKYEKQKIWDSLVRKVEEEIDSDRERASKAVADFNAKIDALMQSFNLDRKTAIRWFVSSLGLSKTDLEYGGGIICYRLSLPYDMETMFDAVCKELSA